MEQVEELEELIEYSEFLEIAGAFIGAADTSDVEDNVFETDFDDDHTVNAEQAIDVEETEGDDEFDIRIMQSIINLIELEDMLEDEIPKKRRERRWGVHPINQVRREQGVFDNLFKEMLMYDHEKFFNFTRMSPERFQHLFELIEFKITKESPNAIPAKCRLLLTLRYFSHRLLETLGSVLYKNPLIFSFLATGDSLKSLHYNFRVGVSTAYNIIRETCDALWDVLQPLYLKFPEEEDWIRIEKEFREKLNLPNCVGAMDGKLIEIFAPSRTGSIYFNYSKYFSTNLLAMCDALKNFTYVDIGSYGQQTDGGVLFNSSFGKRMDMNKLNFPPYTFLPHTSVLFPFFVIADSAFPLKENLLTPYAGDPSNLSAVEANFNREQCSARKIIENVFAILVRRWQIFNGPIEMHPVNVDKILKATVVLHNYIKSFDDPAAIRYMREERFTYPTRESLRSFYESGMHLQDADRSEYASVARDTYAKYLMNIL